MSLPTKMRSRARRALRRARRLGRPRCAPCFRTRGAACASSCCRPNVNSSQQARHFAQAEADAGGASMTRTRLRCVLAAALVTITAAVNAQNYPDRPIRFIVPFAPGGTNDIVARLSGAKLAEKLNQSVVVDNRGGANALIGTEMAARAQPDGYTLLMVNINFAINP